MAFFNSEILLHLLWLFPILAFLYLYSWRRRKRILSLLAGERADSEDAVTLSKRARMARDFCFIIALIFVFLGAARPSWGKKIISVTGSGRDIILVVDVSRSMLAADIQPSRLEHAKWFLRELLVSSCPGDRFGIVAFAGTAMLQCPLTVDRTSLIQLIDELSPDLIPVGGTNIQAALEAALKSFDSAEGGHRAIILISDGEELHGSVDSILEKLKSSRIPIFSVGLGNPFHGTPISIKDEKGRSSFVRDAEGEIVSTKLNEELLSSLATSTGGLYLRSTSTEPGDGKILRQIKAIASEEHSSGENLRPIERFQLPIVIAIILLFLRLALSDRRKIAVTALLFLSLFFHSFADEENVAEPAQNNLKPYELYNLALSKHKDKVTEEAEKLYQSALSSIEADNETQTKSFQNLGVILHEKGRSAAKTNPQQALQEFNEAEKMYREAMREKINLPQIAKNQQLLLDDIQTAKQLIREQQQQKQNSDKAKEEMQKAAEENQKAQNFPQNNEQKEKAIQQNQRAQAAINNYKNKIPDENAQEKENAQNAVEQMKKAEEEQKKENFNKAQEHIENAIEKFSKDEKEPTDKKDSNNNIENQKAAQAKQHDENGKEKQTEKNLDPDMAEAILDQLVKDENKLREEMRKNESEKVRLKKVDKDW